MKATLKIWAEKLKEEALKIGRGIKKLRFFKFTDIHRFISLLTKKEKLLLTCLLAILALDLVGISFNHYKKSTKVVATQGGSFSEGMLGTPRFINPLLAQTSTDKSLVLLEYSGLYKYDGNKIVPDLAANDPVISGDQKQYTIKLKPNLKWQDGKALTADDVIFTFAAIQNPNYKSPFAKQWQNIKADKIDDLTVRFTNKNISSPILANLNLGILPAHIWSEVKASDFMLTKYNIEPVGSGPYMLNEVSKAVSGEIKSMTFKAYTDYRPQRPYIDQVNIKFYGDYSSMISALHSKEVDAIGFIPFDQKAYVDQSKTNLQILQIPVDQYQGLFFNLKNSTKVLGDHAVRQALAQSINRDEFINYVYQGMARPAYTPILNGQLGYDSGIKDSNKFSLDAANALLDSAGWKKGADGIRLKNKQALAFTITTNDFILNQKSAEQLSSQWVKIGVKVSVNIVPTANLEKDVIRPRNFEALLFAETTGFDSDPFVFWHSSQSKDPGLNLTAYTNKTIDMLISQARNTFDLAVRAKYYAQFENIFSSDLPAIILDQSIFVYQVQPKIQGININMLANPENRFYDIGLWYVNTKRIWK